jgi:hypothetical protein
MREQLGKCVCDIVVGYICEVSMEGETRRHQWTEHGVGCEMFRSKYEKDKEGKIPAEIPTKGISWSEQIKKENKIISSVIQNERRHDNNAMGKK